MTVVFLFYQAPLECLVSVSKSHGRVSKCLSRSILSVISFLTTLFYSELLVDFNCSYWRCLKSIMPLTTLFPSTAFVVHLHMNQDIFFQQQGWGGGALLGSLFLVSETDEEYTKGAGKISIQKLVYRRKWRILLDQ